MLFQATLYLKPQYQGVEYQYSMQRQRRQRWSLVGKTDCQIRIPWYFSVLREHKANFYVK